MTAPSRALLEEGGENNTTQPPTFGIHAFPILPLLTSTEYIATLQYVTVCVLYTINKYVQMHFIRLGTTTIALHQQLGGLPHKDANEEKLE